MVVELKGGFKTLWLRFDANSCASHQLFYKEHSVRNQEPEYPRGKTLFVLNVPPWASDDSVRRAISRVCGPVKNANLASNDSTRTKQGFGKVYVVFQRESSLDKALALGRDTTLTLHTEEDTGTVGLSKWCKEYNATVKRNEASIKKEIEEYMREYDEKIARRLANEDNAEAEDEDGWVTVTSKKKRGQFAPARKESTIGKLQSKEERKSRKKELLNFYTFQIREGKKKHLVELRKKFELDKKKLQQLKSKRAFKPF